MSLSAVEYPRDASTEVLAAMACSDLELGNVGWARRTLADATESGRGADHPEISAASARLAILDGRPQDAVELLRPLTRIRNFPFTGVLRARNQVWLGEALRSTGDENASLRAFQAAVRSAPRSCWAETARRLQAIGDGY